MRGVIDDLPVTAFEVKFHVWRYLLGLPSDYDSVNAEWRAKVDPRDQHPELNLPNL
jgi:hypothetical protein